MTFILHDRKMIYIVVPGTGSTSLVQALKVGQTESVEQVTQDKEHAAQFMHPDMHTKKHLTAEQAKYLIDEDIWNEYTKFGFVRKPFEWSRCIYRKGNINHVLGIDPGPSFLEFMRKLNKSPYSWLTNRSGEVLVDRIYRTEDLAYVGQEFDITMPWRNRTNNSKPAKCTQEIEQIIQAKFKRELKHYNE